MEITSNKILLKAIKFINEPVFCFGENAPFGNKERCERYYLVTDVIMNWCVGNSIGVFFEKILLTKTYNFLDTRQGILNSIIDKIIILYYREIMTENDTNDFGYSLLLHTSSGWKFVSINYDVGSMSYAYLCLCDVNVLNTDKDNLEFIITHDYYFTWEMDLRYKYSKIDENKAILFKTTSDGKIFIHVIVNAMALF